MVDSKYMEGNTAQQILDVAQDMVRNRGYSAFSYADISEQIGIRKASIHYHFPSKEELVRKLVQHYREALSRKCDRIAQSLASPQQQLMQFVNLYRDGLKQGQICLCAMLTADFAVLPQAVQEEVRAFFHQTEAWLALLLKCGCEANVWQCYPSVEVEAKGLIALLQGAQLLARTAEDSTAAFEQIVIPILSGKLPSE